MYTHSLSEIVATARKLPTKEEKVAWLKSQDSQPLRTLMMLMYTPEKYVWNIPTTPPPYTPSPHVESQGMLYRQVRKLKYFIKDFAGDRLNQHRREFLFIEILETIDKDDALLMLSVLAQKPFSDLSAEVLNEALGLDLPLTSTKKRGKQIKNV